MFCHSVVHVSQGGTYTTPTLHALGCPSTTVASAVRSSRAKSRPKVGGSGRGDKLEVIPVNARKFDDDQKFATALNPRLDRHAGIYNLQHVQPPVCVDAANHGRSMNPERHNWPKRKTYITCTSLPPGTPALSPTQTNRILTQPRPTHHSTTYHRPSARWSCGSRTPDSPPPAWRCGDRGGNGVGPAGL